MKRLIGLLLAVSTGVFGADNYWNGSTGSWADGSRWSLGHAPGGNSDYVHITDGTAQITSSPAGTVERLYMGGSSGANLEISGDAQFKELYLAEAGQSATISQTGGNVTLSGNYTTHIGRYGTATYNLSGGTLTHASNSGSDTHTFIGVYGGSVGTFNQTGGAFIKNGSIQQNIIVGYGNGSKGIVNLSAGQFLHQVGDEFTLGDLDGSEGYLNISGTAQFQLGDGVGAGTAQPSTGYAILKVGDEGYGELNQTGGSLDTLYLKIADSTTTGEGLYTISGGSLDVRRYLLLGNGSKATLTVAGSGASHIRMKRLYANPGTTINFQLDSGGSTLVEAVGTASDSWMNDAILNGTVTVDTLPGFNAVEGAIYDLVWSAELLTTDDMVFTNRSQTEFDWSVVSKNGGKVLQLEMVGSKTNAVVWNGTGNWMDSASWTDSSGKWGIPGWVVDNPLNTGGSTSPDWNGGDAYVEGGTLNLAAASRPDGSVARLSVGANATLNIGGDLTVRQNVWMGTDGQPGDTATINQLAGNVRLLGGSDYNFFGWGDGESVYNFSGGSLVAEGGNYYFGYGGGSTFTFNQTGGTFTNSASGDFVLGKLLGATGIVNVDAGSFVHTASETLVGQEGYGAFHQSGGTVALGKVSLGRHGLYSISGGSLHLSSFLYGNGGTFEVSGSGASQIDMPAMYLYGETFRVKLDGGGSSLVRVTGGTSVELRSATFEVGTLPGFAAVPGATYDVLWSATGFLTDGMVFSDVSNEADFEWRIVDKDGGKMLQVSVLGSPLEMWTLGYGLGGSAAESTADPDGDGYINQAEFALGGDPTNSADWGIAPTFETGVGSESNSMLYVYPKRTDAGDSLISYYIETSTNLISNVWTNAGYAVVGTGAIDAEFSAVTNRIPMDGKEQQFVRLVVDGVLELDVADYNILGITTPGYEEWDVRKPWIVDALTNAAPDLIGLEEIRYRDMADYLQAQLGSGGYTAFPASNLGIQVRGTSDTVLPDGLQGRHWQNALYYKSSLFEKLDGGQQALYEGDGLDFFSERSITWIKLRHIGTGREFVAIATHLDPHESLRRENATVDLKSFIQTFPSDLPIVLVGDFNALPDTTEIQTLVGDGTMKSVIERPEHIDYIMQRNFLERAGHMFEYQYHGTMPLSDHPMLTAKLALEKER